MDKQPFLVSDCVQLAVNSGVPCGGESSNSLLICTRDDVNLDRNALPKLEVVCLCLWSTYHPIGRITRFIRQGVITISREDAFLDATSAGMFRSGESRYNKRSRWGPEGNASPSTLSTLSTDAYSLMFSSSSSSHSDSYHIVITLVHSTMGLILYW